MSMEYHKHYLIRLKTILQSSILYLILGFLIIIYVLIFTKVIKYKSVYKDENYFTGTVEKYVKKDNATTIYLKAKEKILVSYYDEIDIDIGDNIEVYGTITEILPNTIPNTFNYKDYLYNNHIYTKVTAKKIKVNAKTHNVLTKAKNWVWQRASTNTYLKLFICGDKTGMETNIYNNFKNCGIAHLLAISGMHVSVFILILNKLLFFLQKHYRNIIIILFLLFYAYLVNFTPSILRVVISFIIGTILAWKDIKIPGIKKLLLTAFIIILIDPFNVYSTSFQYSFSAALGVIATEKRQKKNYFINIIVISFYTLLFTLPITINLNYECNLSLFLCNLLFIPYVSFILYPLGLLTFVFSFLNPIFSLSTTIMEKVIGFISKWHIFTINIPRISWLVIIIFYVLLYLYLHYNKKKFLLLITILIVSVKINARLDFNDYVIFFDVGQGDCAALISKWHQKVIMIDTGGLQNYKVSNNVILYFKSIGITKIDSLVLSHGDYDHMGDALDIINNLKVNEVIFNQGEYNDLENNLVENLKQKHIKYSQNANALTFPNAKIYSLNNSIYSDENNSSNVLLIEIDNRKILFMGDAGSVVEQSIIANYDISKIDILKVGHHGSSTSTSEKFIKQINPLYAVISVGRNNRYHHPNQSVVDRLKDAKLYRTDQDGSIIFKIKDNNFSILTYGN